MTIDWVDVKHRVPDDRRQVLAWGFNALHPCRGNGHLMGSTKYNPSPRGGKFDCENSSMFFIPVVTHWAEINGPTGHEPKRRSGPGQPDY